MQIIDATDTILGRLASYVAKNALKGDEIVIVNCEKVVVSGNKDNIFREFKEKRNRGDRYKGPFYPRMPDRIVKRVIRGMLPYKTDRGRKALSRVKTFIGIPEEYQGKKCITLDKIKKEKLKDMMYVYLYEISEYLGAKIKV